MPKLSFLDSLRRRRRQPLSFRVKTSHVFSIGEGQVGVVTYTSTADKMKIFSAFIREGLESGDRVNYVYPDEESKVIRARLEDYEIDVKKHEREGNLILKSLTEYYLPNGHFDKEKLIKDGLNKRVEAKRQGYKHLRELDDLGDFSFLNGQWKTYMDYWDDPKWETPSGPYMEVLTYTPFIIELAAVNVEGMSDTQRTEMLKNFWIGDPSAVVCIDLLEYADAFSRLVNMPHQKIVGRNFLLEFDPSSDYERVVDSLVKEAIANVEPVFIFTSMRSVIHTRLAKQSAVKFFLLSTSISTPESISENEVLLPAKNMALILDSINKILEEYTPSNVFIVFHKLSELVESVGLERTYRFLHYALDMFSSQKVTTLFLLNALAHTPPVTSQIRELFPNLLVYRKNELEVVKIS